jgi:hypothetical protein
VAAAVAIVAVTHGALAQAPPGDDKAAAEALYEEGHALDAQGQYLQACPKYAESLRLDPGIGVMLHLSSCWEKAGKPASAWAEYREAEQVAARAGDSRSEVARHRAEALESRLFRLTIVVPDASAIDGLTIVRDGETVGKAQWGAPVPVDPGPHTIVAMARDKRRWQTTLVVPDHPGAETLAVPPLADENATPGASTALPVSTPEATPPPPRSSWGTQRVAAAAIGGAGIVGVGVGIAFGVLTKVKLDQSNGSGCQPDNHCTSTGATLRNDAIRAGNVSTVAFVVGLGALAGGTALWLTAPRATSPRVGVTAGPGYAAAVVGGAW